MIAYVAHNREGHPIWWTMRPSRKECQERATETMMDWREYEALGYTSARWRSCYRQGCRIRKYELREAP